MSVPKFDAGDYGARPDGSPSDNAKAARAALRDAYAVGGGQVHIPSGVYDWFPWTREVENEGDDGGPACSGRFNP